MAKRPFKPTYLYIKTHNITGLKYFGKTTKNDPYSYMGSGTYWKRHLNIHGCDITTEILGLFVDEEDCKKVALWFSKKMNIVESNKWANFRPESGLDGGDPCMGRSWKETAKSPEDYIRRVAWIKNFNKERNTPEFCERLGRQVSEKQWSGDIGQKRKELHSKKVSGKNNPAAKKYKIIAPDGTEYFVHGGLKKMCKELKISYTIIRSFINRGKITGPSNIKDTSFFTHESKRKLLNWEIIFIGE